jgi:hypothetical protein
VLQAVIANRGRMMLFVAFLLSVAAIQPPRAAVSSDVACGLLTNAEIERIAGAPVVERRPTMEPAGGLLMSQCFFGSSSSRSVSLAVAGAAPGRTKLTPAEYWRRQFHPPEKRAEREGERESDARAIPGVGDEAYWAGNRIAGALYVLRGDTFLRISVGGISDEAQRIETSKALAVAALRRLRRKA